MRGTRQTKTQNIGMQDPFFLSLASQEVSADLGAIFIDNVSGLDLGAY